jgi:hypothetical protein
MKRSGEGKKMAEEGEEGAWGIAHRDAQERRMDARGVHLDAQEWETTMRFGAFCGGAASA